MTAAPPGGGGIARFLRAAGVVFVATAVSNSLLFAASLMASRGLGPARYADISAMLAVIVVLSVPAMALQMASARAVAAADARGQGAARSAVRHELAGSMRAGAVLTIAGLALTPVMVAALDTPVSLVVVTALAGLPLLVASALRGVHQGGGAYAWVGVSLITEALARAVTVAVGVAVFDSALLVAAAPLVGLLCATFLPLAPLRGQGLRALRPDAWPSRGSVGPVVYYAAFSVMVSVDMFVVKASHTSHDAGQYAAAALFGKIILFLPVAVGLVLVSEVARRHSHGEPTAPLLAVALAATMLLSGAVAALTWAFPHAAVEWTSGPEYRDAVPIVGLYALAVSGFALLNVLASYGLARGYRAPGVICLVAIPLEVCAQIVFRDSFEKIVLTLLVTSLLAAAGVAAALWRRARVPAPPGAGG